MTEAPNFIDTNLIYTPLSAIDNLSNWTVASVNSAQGEHSAGSFASSARLVEEVLWRNPRYKAVLQSRLLALFGLPFKVDPANNPGTAAEKKIAKRWEEDWFSAGYWPKKGVASLEESDIGRVIKWGLSLGVGVAQIVPAAVDGRWQPRLMPIHPKYLYWDDSEKLFKIQVQEGTIPIIPGDGRWFLYTPYGYDGFKEAHVMSLAHHCLISSMTLRDWARASEKHGLAMLLAKIPWGIKEKDVNYTRFITSLRTLGREGVILAPQGETEAASFSAELMELKARNYELFKELQGYCNREIVLEVKGENLTTEVDGGSFAATKEHSTTRQDYLESDAEYLKTCKHNQILRPYTHYNDGNADLAPWAYYDATPQEDAKEILEKMGLAVGIVEKLRALGATVDYKEILKKGGVCLMKTPKGEELEPFQGSPEPLPE
jgi:phage gp29-like protein